MNAKSKTARVPKGHDLSSIVKFNRVNAPKQLRSTQSMHRIVEALEELLKRKPFSEITVADIESESKCGLATIYARFRDKKAILAALHESIRDRFQAGIDERMSHERLARLSLEEAARAVATDMVTFYSTQRNLLRAIMLIDDNEVYARAISSIRHATARLQELFAERGDTNDETLRQRIDLAARSMYALLQQWLILAGEPLDPRFRTNKQLVDDLATLLRVLVAAPR